MNRRKLVTMDLEGDGFYDTITEIYCIVCKDYYSGKISRFYLDTLKDFKEFHKTVDTWIAHNGIKYDFPVIEKLMGISTPIERIIDTIVYSRTLGAKRQVPWNIPPEHRKDLTPHSLATWGWRVGRGKPEVHEWQGSMNDPEFRKTMLHRCEEDVQITERTFEVLKEEQEHYKTPESALRIRHRVYDEIALLERNGIYLNKYRADKLYNETGTIRDDLGSKILEHFKPISKSTGETIPKYTKEGALRVDWLKMYDDADEILTLRAKIKKAKDSMKPLNTKEKKQLFMQRFGHLLREEKEIVESFSEMFHPEAPFSTFEWVEFNISSNKMVVEAMNKAGWKPINRTKGYKENQKKVQNGEMTQEEFDEKAVMQWKVDEENLGTLPDTAPESYQYIKEYRVLDKRRDKVREFYDALSPKDNRVHGTITPLATWTHRSTHTGPNMGNLAGVKVREVILVEMDSQGNLLTKLKECA